jgi:DNA-binding MarR family transcriptional regulator
MSLLDEFGTFEQTVVRRLRELEPLVREYRQLRTVAQRLGISYSPDDARTATAGAPTRRGRAAKQRSQPARSAAKAAASRAAPAKSAAKRQTRRRASDATKTGPTASAAAADAAPPTAAAEKTRAPRGGGKAAGARPGQRSDDVLRIVGEQPGITVRELGGRLGVDPTGLYRVANKLTADGRLRKDGPKLYVKAAGAAAASESGTAAPPSADIGASEAAGSADTSTAAAANPSDTATAPPKRSAKTAAKRAATRRPARGSKVRSPAPAKRGAAAAKPAKPPAGRGRARTRNIAHPSRRADDEVMRVVGEEPGITVPAISERLRVNRPDLYRLTDALAKDGRLRKDGPKLYLAETPAEAPQTEARASEPPAAPSSAADREA